MKFSYSYTAGPLRLNLGVRTPSRRHLILLITFTTQFGRIIAHRVASPVSQYSCLLRDCLRHFWCHLWFYPQYKVVYTVSLKCLLVYNPNE